MKNLPTVVRNKFTTYLLYAVGEIVLVVIGILIAVSLNNWNAEQKTRIKELAILGQLKADFAANYDRITRAVELNETSIQRGLELIKFLREYSESNDSNRVKCDRIINEIINGYHKFDPSNGAVDDLINSGNLDIIQNDSIRYHIAQWHSYLTDIEEDYVIRNEHINFGLMPYLIKNYPLLNINGYFDESIVDSHQIPNIQSAYPTDPLRLSNQEFESHVYNFILNQQYVVVEEKGIQAIIQKILHLIEEELKRFN